MANCFGIFFEIATLNFGILVMAVHRHLYANRCMCSPCVHERSCGRWTQVWWSVHSLSIAIANIYICNLRNSSHCSGEQLSEFTATKISAIYVLAAYVVATDEAFAMKPHLMWPFSFWKMVMQQHAFNYRLSQNPPYYRKRLRRLPITIPWRAIYE